MIISLKTFTVTLLLYFIGVASTAIFQNPAVISAYDLYFIVLLLFGLFSLHIQNKCEFEESTNRARFPLNICSTVILILFAAVVIFSHTQGRSIWLDEIIQYQFQEGVTKWAAQQQNPPLDYLLSKFSIIVFGNHEFAYKFHPLVFAFMTIFAPLFFIRENKKESSFALTLSGASLILSSGFSYYSYESRPLSLALFLGVMCLILIMKYLRTNKGLNYLLIYQVLFCLSIGLQPILLIVAIFLCLGIQKIIAKRTDKESEKDPLFKILKVNLLTALLILPFIVKIYIESLGYNQFKKSFSLNQIFLYDYLDIYLDLIGLSTTIFLLILFLKYQQKLRKLPKLQRRNTQEDPLSTLLPLSTVIFFIIYILFFTIMINWNLNTRYLYVALAPIYLYAYQLSTKLTLNIREKVGFLLLLFSLTITSKLLAPNHPRYNYQQVYQQIVQSKESKIINFNYHGLGSWRPRDFIARRIYDKESHKQYINSKEISQIIKGDLSGLSAKTSITPYYKISPKDSVLLMTHKSWSSPFLMTWLKNQKKTWSTGKGNGEIILTSINSLEEFIQDLRKLLKSEDVTKIMKCQILEDLLVYDLKNQRKNQYQQDLSLYLELLPSQATSIEGMLFDQEFFKNRRNLFIKLESQTQWP